MDLRYTRRSDARAAPTDRVAFRDDRRKPFAPYNHPMNAAPAEEVERAIDVLVDRYRSRCLWDLPPDYYPTTLEQRLRVLDRIGRTGDREAFRAASRLRAWLSPRSSGTSVAS